VDSGHLTEYVEMHLIEMEALAGRDEEVVWASNALAFAENRGLVTSAVVYVENTLFLAEAMFVGNAAVVYVD